MTNIKGIRVFAVKKKAILGRLQMKKILFALSMTVAIAGLSAVPAFAQDGSLENEFSAFRKNIQAAKDSAKKTDKPEAPPAEDPLAAYRNDDTVGVPATGVPATGVNPLGPAANLPVSGQIAIPTGGLGVTPQTPEEVQMQMEAEMEEQKLKMREADFNSALEILMPLTPQEVRTLLDKFRDSREAAETPITVPEPKNRIESVSLDPAATPLKIKLAPGYVSTISIIDSTGMPWAIQDLSWAGKVDVDTPETGGHIIRLTPSAAHGSGNISLRLVDLITPVTFSFEIGLEEVDYRFDARIPKQGPLKKVQLIEYGGIKTVAGGNQNIMAVLDGTITGEDSKKLMLEGVDGRTSAWRIDDTVYLRTPLTLLSPSWNESASSGDGMNVYTLGDTPVILLSDGGKMIKARVMPDEGF